jgi:hypothetical protein
VIAEKEKPQGKISVALKEWGEEAKYVCKFICH